uniref:Rhophilin-1 n=1 Tax=Panthera tigris altaica TaxID=74533 RepID=A0A8C9KBZ7_PANTA
RPAGLTSGETEARWKGRGCDPLAQTLRGRLQSRRAQVHQQINKELRMRTGAENLYRATSNAWVRETVALELSYVNSSLQLLKEELEELNGSAEGDRPAGEGVSVPMIPLGLKETKELDWSTPLRELISGHFGEDSASYEAEIRELEDLRQAIRTPSRGEAGLELLMAYYNQLCFLDARFIAPTSNLGLLFQWYDSLTGVPAQQRALAFEKGSVLFNIGALYTQIGARQDRSCPEGTRRAIEAFQRAAGAFSLLRENFSRAPSPDMSPASLSMLERLMTAQAQECIFEGLLLPSTEAPQGCLAQLRLAQEAAQVRAGRLAGLVQEGAATPLPLRRARGGARGGGARPCRWPLAPGWWGGGALPKDCTPAPHRQPAVSALRRPVPGGSSAGGRGGWEQAPSPSEAGGGLAGKVLLPGRPSYSRVPGCGAQAGLCANPWARQG